MPVPAAGGTADHVASPHDVHAVLVTNHTDTVDVHQVLPAVVHVRDGAAPAPKCTAIEVSPGRLHGSACTRTSSGLLNSERSCSERR